MTDPLVREVLEGTGPLYIYGAGDAGREVLALLRRRNREVVAFLDRAPRHAEIDGVPVQLFGQATLLPRAVAVQGLFNPYANTLDIERDLEALGCRSVGFVELHRAADGALRDRYWLENVQPEVPGEAYSLWADEASRALFAATVDFRRMGDASLLPPSDAENPYFPIDLPQWTAVLARPLRIADCGAYDGDTIRDLAIRAGQGQLTVEAIAAFEPDPTNFPAMVKTARECWPNVPVLSWPCGVWHKNETLHFAAGTGSSSALQENGETVVQCVRLDDALHGFAPNFIKMDIEGAEPSALEGARGIVESIRPALAICAYHRADHLWSLAQTLLSWNCGYDCYLRAHCLNSFETVLYGVPR